ncbi:MAG: bifunctional adenosylcobinamide kinase/adenosylcobinamide-phosphate guanylyltransferase [Nitrospirota bacterium]
MKDLILILGGNGAGKSGYALSRGENLGPRKYYLATAQALDEEMAERINRHKKERSESWTTLEEAIKVPDAFGFLNKRADVVVIDCISRWLSHLLMIRNDYDIMAEAQMLLSTIARVDFSVIVVSDEIGCGVTPSDPVSRRYVDTMSQTHRALASMANEVYFMVAGIPLMVKSNSHFADDANVSL